MRTVNRRATRDQLAARDGGDLPELVGGTITGGPLEPVDLMEILNRSSQCASRNGAVSGAAYVAFIGLDAYEGEHAVARDGRDRVIALSDGSRISFASVADAGALRREDASLLSDA